MSEGKERVHTNVHNKKYYFVAVHEVNYKRLTSIYCSAVEEEVSISSQTFGKTPLNPLSSFNVFVGYPNDSIMF